MKIEFPFLTKEEWKLATLSKPTDLEKDSELLEVLDRPECWDDRIGPDVRLPNIYILSYASLKSAACAAYLFGWLDYPLMKSRGGKLLYKLVRSMSLGDDDEVLIWYYIIRLAISKDIPPDEFCAWLRSLGDYKQAAAGYEASLRLARISRNAAKQARECRS